MSWLGCLPPVCAQTARVAEIVRHPNGIVIMLLDDVAPGTYTLESSSDLFNWTPIASHTSQNKVLRFVDSGSVVADRHFYRVVAGDSTKSPPFVKDEVLVRFKTRQDAGSIGSILDRSISGKILNIIDSPTMEVDGLTPIYVASTPLPVMEAAARLNLLEGVDYAHANWKYQPYGLPNDPRFVDGSLWGMNGNFGSRAAGAWQQTNPSVESSPPVYVGLIDTGVQIPHPDLTQNIDASNSWNFLGNNPNVFTAANLDWHGTLMAGTIGAQGDNGRGVVGVNWRTRMIVCKVGTQIAGSSGNANVAGLNSALVTAAFVHLVDVRARQLRRLVAINCSWGIAGPFDQSLFSSIVHAADHEILTVAAAGSGHGPAGLDTSQPGNEHYPSGYDTTAAKSYNSVVAVAALDQNGGLWGPSNYGRTSVHLAAPGVGIWTTDTFSPPQTENYTSASGTSLAAAHVTGAIAFYASANPSASAQQIRTMLLQKVAATLSLTSPTLKCSTGGRLDIAEMIGGISPPCPWFVDMSYGGSLENGSQIAPHKTITAAYAAAQNGCTLRVATGVYAIGTSPLPSKRILFEPLGGDVLLQAR